MTYAGSSGARGLVRSSSRSGVSAYEVVMSPSTVRTGRSWAGSRGAVAVSVTKAAGRASASMYARRSAG
ncbi:hypothetical protein SMD44_08615 [Streptomyces alboflavus]|uniref:Uncharacterized protein n=1 Tax=Streptomyces alboflavus TaxID=67267 RepID=A0A1Z1WRS0_9ACTN|nr:hypothetical protein SMD44_08615 [Streptomyces alboflavus]